MQGDGEESREEDWLLGFIGLYRNVLKETNVRSLISCSWTGSQMYF